MNECWHSWQHHSVFSNMDQGECIRKINDSQINAHHFLKQADWLLITLGSSFSYQVTEASCLYQSGIANCHRAPAQWFNKHMMTIEEIQIVLNNCIYQLFRFNPSVKIIFTVSPVRHVRDGVIENNRSKARLIEVIHHLVNKFEKIFYFPAYELVVDVLRDYRFYDVDLVHPNYQATQVVLDKFMQYFVTEESQKLAEEIQKIVVARKHKPFQSGTEAHKNFSNRSMIKRAHCRQNILFNIAGRNGLFLLLQSCTGLENLNVMLRGHVLDPYKLKSIFETGHHKVEAQPF